jgi:hypothetical protein
MNRNLLNGYILKEVKGMKQSDLDWINCFYKWLQGEKPEHCNYTIKGALTEDQAWSVIYYLQELLPVLPEYIERCDVCGELFDERDEGYYFSFDGTNCCPACMDEKIFK